LGSLIDDALGSSNVFLPAQDFVSFTDACGLEWRLVFDPSYLFPTAPATIIGLNANPVTATPLAGITNVTAAGVSVVFGADVINIQTANAEWTLRVEAMPSLCPTGRSAWSAMRWRLHCSLWRPSHLVRGCSFSRR
jgi:hypothetical protein